MSLKKWKIGLATTAAIVINGGLLGTALWYGVTFKGNLDEQQVDTINKELDATPCKSMTDVISHLKTKNIDLLNTETRSSDAQYVWDQSKNKVFLMNQDGSLHYGPEGYTVPSDKSKIWKMVKAPSENSSNSSIVADEFKSDTSYSQYLRKSESFSGIISFCSGIDTGDNTDILLKLVKDETIETPVDSVTITTNRCGLIVDSTSYTNINHYGTLLDLKLNSLEDEGSFTTSGIIAGDVVIGSGVDASFVIEPEATVNTIFVADPNTTIEVNSDTVGTINPTTPEATTAIDRIVEISEEVTSEPTVEHTQQDVPSIFELSGLGTERSPYILTGIDDFPLMHEYARKGYCYFLYEGEMEVDGSSWECNDLYGDLNGSFDGNGLVINNLSRPLFQTIGVVNGTTEDKPYEVKNVTVNCNMCFESPCAGIAKNVAEYANFENVNVHGLISGAIYVGGFVAFGNGNLLPAGEYHTSKWKFTNCHCDARVITTSDTCGGFIGYHESDCATSEFIFEDSYFDGTLVNTVAPSTPTTKKHAYFSGGTMYDSIKVKTTYSDEFLAQHPNPEGLYYRAPTAKDNGWFYVGNRAPSGKAEYNVYEGYIKSDKVVLLTKQDVTEPESKAQTITGITKQSGITYATASLFIGPNAPQGGNYVKNFLSEELDISGDTLSTVNVKNYNIRVNSDQVTEQGVHGDYYDVWDNGEFYGTTYSSSFILIVQYKEVDGVTTPIYVSRIAVSL